MADGAPRVSVIIVVLDGEAFIREAIASIKAQTFTDWELVVADDGSTDRTRDIVAAEAAADHRIRLVRHPDGGNHGIAATRNLALAAIRGELVAFLDADDVWLADKLADQVAIMDADPALGLLYGRSLVWHSWNPADPTADYYYPLGVEPDRAYAPPVLFELLMRNEAQSPTVCAVMVRADLFRRIGGFEPRFRTMFEDATFFAKALAVAPAFVSDKTWARYRQHGASTSARSAVAGEDDLHRLRFLAWLSRSIGAVTPSREVAAIVRREWRRVAGRIVRRRVKAFARGLVGAVRS